ncbi:hypothetical protein [Stenotrophomonas sp.]|uniref:hypothetical protein n=1 Tax=Stenotrophomonas sp. TaxID=69392 RepID=UPI0028ABCEA5|nr:hypothetical protein [Stenotrophomonas sp.]
MPIEIELPDGTIAEFPDGMPDAEIEAVIQKQFPAPAAAQPEPAYRATDAMSGLDRFRAGIGKGLTDAGEGIAQAVVDQASRPIPALADIFANINPEIASQVEQTLLRPQKAMREHVAQRRAGDEDLMSTGAGKVGDLVGAFAGAAPMGGVGVAARGVSAARAIGQSALAGAFQGSLQPVVSNEERLKNSTLGAAFGGGLSAAGRGVMRVAEEVLPSNTLARVMNYFGDRANKTPYAAESEALAQRTGIDFTPGMVSGGKAQTAMENMARQSVFSADTAFQADERIANQAIQNVRNVMDRISRDDLSPQGIGEGIQNTVRRAVEQIAESREQTAARQFGAIRDMVGDSPVVDYATTKKVLQDILGEYGDVIGAESGKIRAQAQAMLDEIMQKGAGVSLDAARRSRGAYGAAARGSANVFQDINPAVDRRLAARMYGAISDDMDAAAGRIDEAAGFGRQIPVPEGVQVTRPSEMLKQANDDYRRHSQLLEAVKNSPLKRLLGDEYNVEDFMTVNTLPPETVIQRMGSMKPSELNMVRDFMEKNAPDTWQQYKRMLVDDALSAAESAPTSSGANHVPFNASGFMRALGGDKPGKVDQLRAIFNPGEMAEVMDAMQAARRLGDKFGANFSGTGPYAEVVQASTGFVDAIKNASLRGIAGAASPVIGLRGVARMMLNSDGRRGLIELAKLPPGSKRANDLAAYLASVAAVRADSGDEPLEIEVTGGQPGAAPTQEEMEVLRAQSRANAQLGQ